MKTLSGIFLTGLWLIAQQPAQAEVKTACSDEFQTLRSLSQKLAAGPAGAGEIEAIDSQIGQAQGAYQSCIDAYTDQNGVDAAAQLESSLFAQTPNS